MLAISKFLFSNKNLTGLGFSSIIIILAFFGILKSLILPLTIMCYILGYFITPKEELTETDTNANNNSIEAYLDILAEINSNVNKSSTLPVEAKKIVTNISNTTTELLNFQKQKNTLNNTTEDSLILQSILETYLPKIINQYNLLPANYANNTKSSNGKTAKEMIIEQLTILDEKITEISHNIYENDVTAMKVNGNFLKKKFNETNIFEFESEISK